MAPNAQQAFQAWLLKLEIIGGSACALIFVACVIVAVVIILSSGGKGKRWEP
ncbi:MAG: hypothetical protein ACKVP0_17970 [Pirellulaceae bacterium]